MIDKILVLGSPLYTQRTKAHGSQNAFELEGMFFMETYTKKRAYVFSKNNFL